MKGQANNMLNCQAPHGVPSLSLFLCYSLPLSLTHIHTHMAECCLGNYSSKFLVV